MTQAALEALTAPTAPTAPIIRSLADVPGCTLSPGDAEHLAEVVRDAGSSLFLEIWEPGCAQPVGEPGGPGEVVVVLSGQAEVTVDGEVRVLGPGDVVLLDGGGRRVVNASSDERLYTLVAAAGDDELARRISSGALARGCRASLGEMGR